MRLPTKESFMDSLKQYTVPVAAAVYVLGFAAKLHEYIDKIGWRITSVAFLLLGVAWAVYVCSAIEMSVIEPRAQLRKFNAKHRWVAAFIVVASAAPVWFAIQPAAPFRVPPLGVKISNPTNAIVGIAEFGEFYLTAVSSPAMDTQVGAGKLRFIDVSNPNASALTVAPGAEIALLAIVVNPLRFKALLETEELSMRLVVFQTDGTLLTRAGVPFDANELGSSYVALTAR